MKAAPPSSRRGWLPPLLWALGVLSLLVLACVLNEELREVVLEGVGYLLGFVSTPFILEATAACVGLGIVFIINNLRIEREGDGWVEMEIKEEPKEKTGPAEKP